MRTICSTLLMLMLAPAASAGQIALEIVDYTPRVYSLQPVYVLYEVSNVGSSPVVLPIGWCGSHGVYVEARSREGESWYGINYEASAISHCDYRLISLSPGERWLLRAEKTPANWAEGVFQLRAVARSTGVCQGEPGRAEELQTQPIPPISPPSTADRYFVPAQKYVCWDGEVFSEPVQVQVVVPHGLQDRAVRGWLGDPPGLARHRRELVERYPQSQYTYARLLRPDGHLAMQKAMALQPENPLNAAVLATWAHRLLSCTTPCEQDPCAEPLDTPISELPVSDPIKAWLEQEKQRMAAACPEIIEQRQHFEEYKRRMEAKGYDMPD